MDIDRGLRTLNSGMGLVLAMEMESAVRIAKKSNLHQYFPWYKDRLFSLKATLGFKPHFSVLFNGYIERVLYP